MARFFPGAATARFPLQSKESITEAELKVAQHILGSLLLLAASITTAAAELPDSALSQLDAAVIAAVADGDFVAGSYASGELAPPSAGYRDRLVLLRRTVAWHPSGRFLAVNLNTRNQVLFLSLRSDGEKFLPAPWGEPVKVGRDPFVGRFAPDGRHYITSDWGRNFDADTLAGRLPEAPSQLSVVRLAAPDATAPRHRLVHSARSDQSAEGLAISGDGRLVATVNMRGTPFPEQSPRFQRRASVSLFRFDAAAGRLRKIADTQFTGVLPEGGTFDPSGKYFLASVFEYRNTRGGGIEVFRVEKDGLEHLGRIAMPHGLHHIAITN